MAMPWHSLSICGVAGATTTPENTVGGKKRHSARLLSVSTCCSDLESAGRLDSAVFAHLEADTCAGSEWDPCDWVAHQEDDAPSSPGSPSQSSASSGSPSSGRNRERHHFWQPVEDGRAKPQSSDVGATKVLMEDVWLSFQTPEPGGLPQDGADFCLHKEDIAIRPPPMQHEKPKRAASKDGCQIVRYIDEDRNRRHAQTPSVDDDPQPPPEPSDVLQSTAGDQEEQRASKESPGFEVLRSGNEIVLLPATEDEQTSAMRSTRSSPSGAKPPLKRKLHTRKAHTLASLPELQQGHLAVWSRSRKPTRVHSLGSLPPIREE